MSNVRDGAVSAANLEDIGDIGEWYSRFDDDE